MHNTTDVDSCQRAIRAIEIEEYNLHTPTPKRELPPVDSLVIGVDIDREERRQKITRRLKQRLENGMVEEVKGLLDEGIPAEDLIYYGLEYKFVTEYITGQLTYDEMFKRLEIAIHQFAKRQMTWFRGMERRGFTIHWIDAMQPMEEKVAQILEMTK
jgi:tRNA dimethylallyltransferase